MCNFHGHLSCVYRNLLEKSTIYKHSGLCSIRAQFNILFCFFPLTYLLCLNKCFKHGSLYVYIYICKFYVIILCCSPTYLSHIWFIDIFIEIVLALNLKQKQLLKVGMNRFLIGVYLVFMYRLVLEALAFTSMLFAFKHGILCIVLSALLN